MQSRLVGKQRLPLCFGHRGASAAFPENTMASFQAAIRDGSEGIESDVHVSRDNVVLMFHDPDLSRTTNGKGLIREQEYHGDSGMKHLRTTKEPHQPIPTFTETVALLMQTENRHVEFNVDVKIWNDPDRLFGLMKSDIEAQENWQTDLAPRIILGLWHPRFIEPARRLLPYAIRSHIGLSPYIAREYFFKDVQNISIAFSALCTVEGQRFLQECKASKKKVMVWTVNSPDQMVEATRWGVDAILTDVTKTWLDLRAALDKDYDATVALHGSRMFLWTNWYCYTPVQQFFWWGLRKRLENYGGPLTAAPPEPLAPTAAVAA
ncbi:PLC-like phosphodiesterase [Auriculariales sp. MPI-PUGE-AT-0066]|nr:PLC-like phosphodiesterase [Auriculariales sp. MPI-PUGE-AT-0066]